MSLFSRFARESLWLSAARVGAQLAGAVATILLARTLGRNGFGEYALMTALVGIGNVLSTFGSDMVLIREMAARADVSKIPAAVAIQLGLSLAFIAAIVPLSALLPNQTRAGIAAIQIYSLALIPLSFFTVFTSVLRGLQRMGWYAALNLMLAVLQVSVILGALTVGAQIVGLAWLLLGLQTAGALIAGALCALCVPGFFWRWQISSHDVRSLLAACLPVAAISVVGILYQRQGLLMLAIMGGAASVGVFSAAARTLEAAKTFHVAAFTALYPHMARAASQGESNWGAAMRAPAWSLLASAALISILLFGLAPILVNVLFGEQFSASILPLRVLAWTFAPYAANTFLTLALLARRQETAVLRSIAASLLGALILNLRWIPDHGPLGCAWATLCAEAFQSALLTFHWARLAAPPKKGM